LREKEAGRASPKRASGARKMRGADWGELRVLRDLRKAVIGKVTRKEGVLGVP
jgi:hypothetical protein